MLRLRPRSPKHRQLLPSPCIFRVGPGYIKRHIEAPMSMWDQYRTRAAEFHARARNESDAMTRRQYESLATQYSRLAERADRNAVADLSREPPRPKSGKSQKLK
jgi:hypothetical protein